MKLRLRYHIRRHCWGAKYLVPKRKFVMDWIRVDSRRLRLQTFTLSNLANLLRSNNSMAATRINQNWVNWACTIWKLKCYLPSRLTEVCQFQCGFTIYILNFSLPFAPTMTPSLPTSTIFLGGQKVLCFLLNLRKLQKLSSKGKLRRQQRYIDTLINIKQHR